MEIHHSRKIPYVLTVVSLKRRNRGFVFVILKYHYEITNYEKCIRFCLHSSTRKKITLALTVRPLAIASDFTRFMRAGGLSDGLDLPTQEKIRGDSQHDEDEQKSENIQSKVSVEHVQFLQGRLRIFEVAIHLKNTRKFSNIRNRYPRRLTS